MIIRKVKMRDDTSHFKFESVLKHQSTSIPIQSSVYNSTLFYQDTENKLQEKKGVTHYNYRTVELISSFSKT